MTHPDTPSPANLGRRAKTGITGRYPTSFIKTGGGTALAAVRRDTLMHRSLALDGEKAAAARPFDALTTTPLNRS